MLHFCPSGEGFGEPSEPLAVLGPRSIQFHKRCHACPRIESVATGPNRTITQYRVGILNLTSASACRRINALTYPKNIQAATITFTPRFSNPSPHQIVRSVLSPRLHAPNRRLPKTPYPVSEPKSLSSGHGVASIVELRFCLQPFAQKLLVQRDARRWCSVGDCAVFRRPRMFGFSPRIGRRSLGDVGCRRCSLIVFVFLVYPDRHSGEAKRNEQQDRSIKGPTRPKAVRKHHSAYYPTHSTCPLPWFH